MFETASKKLEEFIHVHHIRWVSSHRNPDGLTVWVYERTPRLDAVVEEYRQIVAAAYHKRRD